MKKSLIRLAASVVLSVALVAVISASGILTNGHRSDGLFYQASGIRPDAELLTVNGETIDAEEYLYWVAYDCEYLSANVSDLDFDAELSDGMTYGAYAKQDALGPTVPPGWSVILPVLLPISSSMVLNLRSVQNMNSAPWIWEILCTRCWSL